MKKKGFTTSATNRFLKLAGLAGKVGTSILKEKGVNVFRSANIAKEKLSRNNVLNAARIANTLGRLKGGAMKVGQMIGLQEGLLPPEVTKILQQLQKNAPSVPFDELRKVAMSELGEEFKQFKSIDEISYAAASIGQVHKAILNDGRSVVIKIQYPKIDKVIKADLKNLKIVFRNIQA